MCSWAKGNFVFSYKADSLLYVPLPFRHPQFATDFMFIPNQDDGGSDGSDTNCSNDDVFGCWTPSFAVVDNGWLANSPFPGNIPDDYAYLVVDDVDSHQGGPPGIPEALDQAVPAMDIAWSAPVLGSPSYALGYVLLQQGS